MSIVRYLSGLIWKLTFTSSHSCYLRSDLPGVHHGRSSRPVLVYIFLRGQIPRSRRFYMVCPKCNQVLGIKNLTAFFRTSLSSFISRGTKCRLWFIYSGHTCWLAILFSVVCLWIFVCQCASSRWRGEAEYNLKKDKISPSIRWVMHALLGLVVLGPVGKNCLQFMQGSGLMNVHRTEVPDAWYLIANLFASSNHMGILWGQ